MKKYLLLALIMFLSLAQGLAQRGGSGHLTIISEEDEPFYLYLNNVRYNKTAAVAVRVEEVKNTSYDVKIEFKNRRLADVIVRGVSVADEAGFMQDITYSVSANRRGNRALVIYSILPMSPIYINVDEMEIMNFGRPGVRKSFSNDFRGRWEGSGYNYRGGKGPGRTPGYDNHGNVPHNIAPMAPTDFRKAMDAIRNESMSSNKLNLANTILASNFMDTDQIVAMMNLFSFESDKLKFVKAAYLKCVDPQNYYKVVQELTYSSSKTELNNFIQGK